MASAQSNSTPVKAQYGGRLRADYDYRAAGSDKDSDLYQYWNGSARDLLGGRLDAYVSGRSHQDLDGRSSSLADNGFTGIEDSKGVEETRLLQCYGDAHDQADNVRVRAGRQYIESSDYLHIDGARAMLFEKERLGAGGYYGKPVSYYSTLSGDRAGGVWIQGRPWEGNRSRVTFAEYDADDGETDRNYFMDSYQTLSDAARLSGQASLLNDEFRMARGDFSYAVPGGSTDFYCGGSHWGEFDARTRAYSPLYNVLGEQQPATYAYARVAQQLTPKLLLTPGYSCRIAEGDDKDYANRGYNDYDVALTYEPTKRVSASVSLDYWDLSEGDSFLGVSGEVRYRHNKIWEVSMGTSYADYSYNTYSDISYSMSGGQTVFSEDGTVKVEDPNAYTYFLRFKWHITRKLIMRLQGDVEDESTSDDLAYRGRASVEVRL